MLLALAAVLAAAAPAPDAGLHRFSQVALSPAGTEVAAVESVVPVDTGAPDPHTAIVVRSASGAVLRRIDPCPTCGYGAPAWSPDGGSIAFVVTDRAVGTATLTVATGAKLRSLASVRGVAQTPRWSPDGKTIAMLAVEGATKATGAVEAGAAQVGEIGAAEDEQRIATIPAAGARSAWSRPLTPSSTNTTGPPMARASSRRRQRATATIIGGWRS